jgi:hypothetical protein
MNADNKELASATLIHSFFDFICVHLRLSAVKSAKRSVRGGTEKEEETEWHPFHSASFDSHFYRNPALCMDQYAM